MGYKDLEEYVIEHFKYGSIINLFELNDLLIRYKLTDEEIEEIKILLKELSIDVKYY